MGASTSSSINIESLSENREAFAAKLKEKCETILKENSGNRAAKYALTYLATDEGKSLSDEGKDTFRFLKSTFNDMISHCVKLI